MGRGGAGGQGKSYGPGLVLGCLVWETRTARSLGKKIKGGLAVLLCEPLALSHFLCPGKINRLPDRLQLWGVPGVEVLVVLSALESMAENPGEKIRFAVSLHDIAELFAGIMRIWNDDAVRNPVILGDPGSQPGFVHVKHAVGDAPDLPVDCVPLLRVKLRVHAIVP